MSSSNHLYSDSKLAWVAGFWEGEGSVGCYKCHNGSYTWYRTMVQIPQMNLYIMKYLKKNFGGNYGRYKIKNGYVYTWRLCSRKAIAFIKLIQPYVLMPRRQKEITKALRLDNTKVNKEHFNYGKSHVS